MAYLDPLSIQRLLDHLNEIHKEVVVMRNKISGPAFVLVLLFSVSLGLFAGYPQAAPVPEARTALETPLKGTPKMRCPCERMGVCPCDKMKGCPCEEE